MGLLSQLVEQKIKGVNEEKEKAQKKLEAATINASIMELAKQSSDPSDAEKTATIIDAIGTGNPDASKLVYQSIEQRIKDKNDFDQALKLEKYKAGTAAVTEVVKNMADKGGLSPEQLQQIQMESADRVYKSLGVNDIAQTIKKNTQSQTPSQPQPTTPSNDFFTQPIQPKKTEKQLDVEQQMKRGAELIDMAEKNYNTISKKYGTGRLKGIATTLRGGLGDLLPKGEQAPEVKPYLGNLDGIAQFVGRNVYNDDRVSNEDRKAYRKSLAELTASPDEAKIFFSTLKRFTQTGNVKDQEAIRMMVDKSGKGMLPSQAMAAVSGDFSKMSLAEKKELLKKKLGQ